MPPTNSPKTNLKQQNPKSQSESVKRTEIINIRSKKPYDQYIGRGTPYGNPFVIGVHGDRTQVLAQYEDHLRSDPELLVLIEELRGKTLACHCKPLPCHGDIIIKVLDERQS